MSYLRNCSRPGLLICALLLSSAGFAAEVKLTGTKYLHEAKVSLVKAEQIALGAYPGTFVSKELERESGGSGLRYSFDIRGAESVHEVGVDAKTGRVLENSVENGGD